jgi:hypothetical protein
MRITHRAVAALAALSIVGGTVGMAKLASADQQLLGSCSGITGVGAFNGPLTDQSQPTAFAAKLASNANTHAPLGGSCTLAKGTPTDPIVPSTLTPTSVVLKLNGVASCAQGPSAIGADANAANAFPLTGKLAIKFAQTWGAGNKDVGKPIVIQADVSVLGVLLDSVDLTGIVTKGPLVGAQITGGVWEDPATKLSKKSVAYPGYKNSGYAFDTARAASLLTTCGDSIAHNQGTNTLGTVLIGDGLSPAGINTGGLQFSYGE